MTTKDISYYQGLPWTRTVAPANDPLEPWTARILELPGCMSHGTTPQEAFTGLEDALTAYVDGALAVGNHIVEPIRPEQFKGMIAYRTRPEVHWRLAREAQLRGVSINRLIDEAVVSRLEQAS